MFSKVFLKSSRYSQEITCAGILLRLKTCKFIKKGLQNIPVNIANFLRTASVKSLKSVMESVAFLKS